MRLALEAIHLGCVVGFLFGVMLCAVGMFTMFITPHSKMKRVGEGFEAALNGSLIAFLCLIAAMFFRSFLSE